MSDRGPGRPPLDPSDRRIPVSVSLPAKQFDKLCAIAIREDRSVPEVIRGILNAAAGQPTSE